MFPLALTVVASAAPGESRPTSVGLWSGSGLRLGLVIRLTGPGPGPGVPLGLLVIELECS